MADRSILCIHKRDQLYTHANNPTNTYANTSRKPPGQPAAARTARCRANCTMMTTGPGYSHQSPSTHSRKERHVVRETKSSLAAHLTVSSFPQKHARLSAVSPFLLRDSRLAPPSLTSTRARSASRSIGRCRPVSLPIWGVKTRKIRRNFHVSDGKDAAKDHSRCVRHNIRKEEILSGASTSRS